MCSEFFQGGFYAARYVVHRTQMGGEGGWYGDEKDVGIYMRGDVVW